MILDIITLCAIAFGFYQGFSSGLIKTLFSALALFVGIIVAIKFSDVTIGLLQNSLSINPAILFVVGFVLTFVLVMVLIKFIGKTLEKFAKAIQIGSVDKILGGLFMALFYSVIISFAVYFMNKIELIKEDTKTASITYQYLEPLPQATQGIGKVIQPIFNDFWVKMMDTMDSIKDNNDGTQNQNLENEIQ